MPKLNDSKTFEEHVSDEFSKLHKKFEDIQARNGGLSEDDVKYLKGVKDEFESFKKKNRDRLISLPGVQDEKQEFLISEAVKACRLQKNVSRDEAWKGAGFELEVIQQVNKKLNKDLSAGTGVDGGFILPTEMDSIITPMPTPNRPVTSEMGLRTISNVGVGNYELPYASQRTTAYWVGETEKPAKTQPKFGTKTLTEKKVAAYTMCPNSIIRQGRGGMEAYLREDLQNAIGDGIESAVIGGSGLDKQPKGILKHTGILAGPSLGANGGQFKIKPHFGKMINQLMVANQLNGSIGVVMHPLVYFGLQIDGSISYSGQTEGKQPYVQNAPILTPAQLDAVLGFKIRTTTLFPTGGEMNVGTGTSQSGVLIGRFPEGTLVTWGGREIKVSDIAHDGTTSAFHQDCFFVYIQQTCDFAVRDEGAFVLTKGCETANLVG